MASPETQGRAGQGAGVDISTEELFDFCSCALCLPL